MKKQYKLIIPKPCKENWNEMTAIEKGRFCAVCSKNLIDFTDKSRSEIQEILSVSQEQICGRINAEQLDSVHIEIPEYAFRKQYSFVKIFAISLLLVMGTTLLSCNLDGKIKKIETVTVVENANKKLNNDDDNDGIPNEFDVYNAVPSEKNDLLQKRKDSLVKEGRELFKQDSIEENRLKKYESLRKYKPHRKPYPMVGVLARPNPHESKTQKIPKIPLNEQLKQDIALLALGRKKPSEITKHFCDSNPKIVVNHKTITFSEFYEKIKGRKIKIRKLRVKKDNNCISMLNLKYKSFFIKKDNSILDKKPILKKKDTIVKQINSSEAVNPKAKDSIKKN